MQSKAQMVERIPVASEVAKGRYAIGFQQVSELLPVPGVTFVGELPDNLQYITRFAGAVTVSADHPQEGRRCWRIWPHRRRRRPSTPPVCEAWPPPRRSARRILFNNQLLQLCRHVGLNTAAEADQAYRAVTTGSVSGTARRTECSPAGIDIAGTAAMPMPASTIPSIVVTWRVSQMLGRAGVRCASSRSSSVRLPETRSRPI
jgi:hypothetical protein